MIAFGHSILAMSGEETLAQVYREVESPKLPNFKKVGFIVFAYSLLLTGSTNFLAVLLIPRGERLNDYKDNWLGGLAMHMVGPVWLQLCLNAFVVIVGFLILSGAVNTSIVGSNGVLSRVAEDGVLPDWFLKPHRRYGTHYRVLVFDRGAAVVDDFGEPRRCDSAGRGVCVRRDLEFRVQHAFDGSAAVQKAAKARSSRCRLISLGAACSCRSVCR